jgi:endonuclease/exonuclease/phosphatase family metal-dependent hydrolase
MPNLKIATFNLKNLALPDRETYPGEQIDRAEYDKKVQWTADLLAEMDADFVGFQEVFHKQALEEVAARTGRYAGAVVDLADENGRLPRVGFLSRLPILKTEVIRDFPLESRLDIGGQFLPFLSFHRPVFRVEVALPGGRPAVILVTHLKSKRPMVDEGHDRRHPWELARGQARSLVLRACEAAALRWIVLQEIRHTETPVILLGDLNDSTHAVTSDILQGDHPQRYYPPDVKKRLWDILLYSCGDLQVRKSYKDVYYTHLHDSQYESLDHIFVSQEFVADNPRHLAYVEYMRLYNDHLLDPALTDEMPRSWVSDHGAVVVSLKMR